MGGAGIGAAAPTQDYSQPQQNPMGSSTPAGGKGGGGVASGGMGGGYSSGSGPATDPSPFLQQPQGGYGQTAQNTAMAPSKITQEQLQTFQQKTQLQDL